MIALSNSALLIAAIPLNASRASGSPATATAEVPFVATLGDAANVCSDASTGMPGSAGISMGCDGSVGGGWSETGSEANESGLPVSDVAEKRESGMIGGPALGISALRAT
jgi:hypothetical protein